MKLLYSEKDIYELQSKYIADFVLYWRDREKTCKELEELLCACLLGTLYFDKAHKIAWSLVYKNNEKFNWFSDVHTKSDIEKFCKTYITGGLNG